MHILSRDAGERISIGQDITLCVVSVNDNKVRLGIDAPKSISVHRSEIYERIISQRAEHPVIDPLAKS